nr:hypothetical protein [Tanacetum cinerariifolium]
MDARLDALSIDFDEELYPYMLTAIAGRRWVIGHGLRLAMMKYAESLEMRQAFADVVLLDQLEGLKDAPIDVIMAALYLESDTGGMPHNLYVTSAPAPLSSPSRRAKQKKRSRIVCHTHGVGSAHHASSSQLTIPVYPEVRDPRNPWACKEEIALADAIAANISRAEKKKKCRIVCRTHGVGSAHHARSDSVPVSVPSVVPQCLALLLVDVATQTDPEDSLL